MAKTNAQKQRAMRQETLREWLSQKCTAQHLVDNLEKIEKLDPESESFSNELTKYKTANDQRLRIMSKYLPDLKQQEIQLEAEHTFAQISDELLTEEWENQFGE